MRLCVLSNSHGSSLKWAETETKPVKGLKMRIFGASASGLMQMAFDRDRRVFYTKNPKIAEMLRITSDGADELALDDYDAFLIHGLYFTVPRLDKRHSRAVREQTADSIVNQFVGLHLGRVLRAATDLPVFLSPDPLYADVGRERLPEPASLPTQPMDYEDVCGLMVERIGDPGFHYVWQRSETMGPKLNTLVTYSTGSKRYLNHELRLRHDVRHMNGAYGRMVLEDTKAAFYNLA
jgi:hypothetical protein